MWSSPGKESESTATSYAYWWPRFDLKSTVMRRWKWSTLLTSPSPHTLARTSLPGTIRRRTLSASIDAASGRAPNAAKSMYDRTSLSDVAFLRASPMSFAASFFSKYSGLPRKRPNVPSKSPFPAHSSNLSSSASFSAISNSLVNSN